MWGKSYYSHAKNYKTHKCFMCKLYHLHFIPLSYLNDWKNVNFHVCIICSYYGQNLLIENKIQISDMRDINFLNRLFNAI